MRTLQIQTPAWAIDFLKPSRYKAIFGGRGSGKSHFFAERVIEEHISNHNTSTVCLREIQRSLTQSVKKLLELKISDLNCGDYFEVQDSVIKSKGGNGIIIFNGLQSHTSDTIKSLQGFDRAWVEEAQTLSEKSLHDLIPTIRNDDSELWFSWNPRKPTDAVDKLFRGEYPPEDSIIKRVNYTENPWFPSVLRKEMEYDRKRDKAKFAHVWLGEYQTVSDAIVFTNWTVEEFEAPPDAHFRFGADWGFANDPTVLIRCFVVGKKLYIDYEAYMIGCEITQIPDLFSTVPDSEKWPIIADSSRPETISYLNKLGGLKIMSAVKGKNSIYEGIEWLKSFDIVVHPRCKHTIDELSSYCYKVDETLNSVMPFVDENNHVIDALRYACESARRFSASKKVDPITHIEMPKRW